MHTLGDYHDLYVTVDVLLLSDIFENFRTRCQNYYKIDPCHTYTAPGLAWQVCLKMTKVRSELLTDIDMHLFIEKGIRGGVAMISHRYAKANNAYLSNYDSKLPSSYIIYLDANNLYGWAMSQHLPTHDFSWAEEDVNFMNVPDDSEIGYIFEVDLEYPDELHDLHNSYPLAPEKIEIIVELNSATPNAFLRRIDGKSAYCFIQQILRNEGLTCAIGIQLNISLFTIRSVVKKFNETGSTENKVRNGRPGIFSAREKRSIIKEVKKDPKISAPQLAKDVANTSHRTFSVQTMRNILHEESYYGRAARKKPFISERNRRKSDGRQYVWKKSNTELEKQHLTPTVKHGGRSVLVWGCMAANGIGKLCFIDGIATARTYIDILRHNLQSSAQKLGFGTSYVFQQDNDPKHTANLTREWLLYNSPRQLKTPPQ
ncbi:transposable element Tcb1 transposase [Trichonephila clavipes]|nr:transposable element Tcb1 transposase [Trichonephila clavipes]